MLPRFSRMYRMKKLSKVWKKDGILFHTTVKSRGRNLKNLQEVLFSSTYFSFNNIVYKQKLDAPMEAPTSPIFVDIVMQDLKNECLQKLDYYTPLFCRYVNDCFLLLRIDKINHTLETFDNYRKLKFTHELEKDGKLSFLDVKVIKSNGELITNWYRKSTFSYRILHFKSYHQIKKSYGL